MATNPSISFYTSDFLTQTMFLSFEDKGKLIMLYCLQHQHGHLTKEQMKKVCGNISEDIMSFFITDEEGKYYNEQIEQAVIARDKFVQSQRNKVNNRWKKKNTKEDTEVIPNKYRGNTAVNTAEIPFENEIEIEIDKDYDNNIDKDKGIRVLREKGKGRRFRKPTQEEIKDFALQNGLRTDAIADFCDYYDSNGWKVGKNPMKDWKATYRRWCRSEFRNKSSGKKTNEFLDMLRQDELEEQIIDTEVMI